MRARDGARERRKARGEGREEKGHTAVERGWRGRKGKGGVMRKVYGERGIRGSADDEKW